MGRVSYHWLKAFNQKGVETVSIDPSNIDRPMHKSFFDLYARASYKKIHKSGDLLLVHEPSAGAFVGTGIPVVAFSHGIEERLAKIENEINPGTATFRSKLTAPLWYRRKLAARKGIIEANQLLVLNTEDYRYVKERYNRSSENTFLYSNGVYKWDKKKDPGKDRKTILFVGSWIARKGIVLIHHAYSRLQNRENVQWVFAGTGISEHEVRSYLGAEIAANVSVIPHFELADESALYEPGAIFILPSSTEGKPLSLLQAMHQGMCCISTNSCGQQDLIQSGTNGFLFPVGDREAFTALLEMALESSALRAELGRKASESVSTLSWEHVSQETATWILERHS